MYDLIDTFRIRDKSTNEVLGEIYFKVNYFSSSIDRLFCATIRVEHDNQLNIPLIEQFEFEVFQGKVRPTIINFFLLPTNLRGKKVSTFVLNKVYQYLPSEILLATPKVCGRLAAMSSKDNVRRSRDHIYKKLIAFDNGGDDAEFVINEHGAGRFAGNFNDVGNSWNQTIIVEHIC